MRSHPPNHTRSLRNHRDEAPLTGIVKRAARNPFKVLLQCPPDPVGKHRDWPTIMFLWTGNFSTYGQRYKPFDLGNLDVQTHCTFKRLQVSCVHLSQVSDGLNGDNFIGQMSFSLTSQSNSSASQCNCSSTVAHSFHSSLIGIHLESVAHIETSWKLISLEQYIGLKAQLHY